MLLFLLMDRYKHKYEIVLISLQVIVDFLPEIVSLIGPQAPIPVLPPNETRQRFESVIIAFFHLFLASFTVILFFDGAWKLYTSLFY